MKLPVYYTRALRLVVALLVLAPLLAACASAAQQSAPPPTALVAQSTAPAAPAAPATPAAPAAPATKPSATATAAAPATTVDATAVAPTPIAGNGPGGLVYPLKTPYLEFGVVTHLYYTDRARVLQLTQNAGFDWVRQQIVWKDTEGPAPGKFAWDELDPIVTSVNNYGRKLLVNIVQAPSFYTSDGKNGLPQDPKSLGNFVETLAKRYGNQIGAYEIWNEQNLAHETGGTIALEDAGKYVELVVECYKRIKAITPEAFVLIGGPSSSGVTRSDIAVADQDYYRAMYSYKDGLIKNYFDAQGVHPGGSANPPETLWPDNPSKAQGWTDDATFYFRHVENVRKIMEEYGLTDHQIWITEYGWATDNDTPGYEFGKQVTLDQQATYVSGAMKLGYEKYKPWLGNMFLWNMNFAVLWNEQTPPQPRHEQASFAILNPDWSPRPSFLAAQNLIAQIKTEEGREK